MRKHITRILTTLLALAMLLPIVVQAAPTDGWTEPALRIRFTQNSGIEKI